MNETQENLDNGSQIAPNEANNQVNATEYGENLIKNGKSTEQACKNAQNNNADLCKISVSVDTASDPVSDVSVENSTQNENIFESFCLNDDENKLFSQLFPGITRENVENDRFFKLFAQNRAQSSSFCELYGDYREFVDEISNEIRIKEGFALKAKQSSPGALSSSESYDDGFFTKDQVLKMSKEEIARNYDKIRKSQQKW